MARNRKTVRAAERRAAEAAYEQIAAGEEPALKHLRHQGWLTTTDGCVLDGDTVNEIRALMEAHRTAMQQVVNTALRPGASNKEIARDVDNLMKVVDRRLLHVLDQALTTPKPHGG